MSKNSKQPISNNKRIDRLVLFIVIPCIFLVIALCILALSIKDKNDVLIQKERMSAYLENKYGEKFIVTDAAYEGSGLAVDGSWRGHARPESDSSLSFQVDEYKDGYEDQYISAIWSAKESDLIQKKADTIYGPSNSRVSSSLVLNGQLLDIATKSAPTLEDAKMKYSDLIYYKLSVIATDNISSSFSLDNNIDQTFSLISSLRSEGVKNLDITYKVSFNDKEQVCSVGASASKLIVSQDLLKKCVIQEEK